MVKPPAPLSLQSLTPTPSLCQAGDKLERSTYPQPGAERGTFSPILKLQDLGPWAGVGISRVECPPIQLPAGLDVVREESGGCSVPEAAALTRAQRCLAAKQVDPESSRGSTLRTESMLEDQGTGQ